MGYLLVRGIQQKMPIPNDFQTREYRECLELVTDLHGRVEKGEVVSILVVTEDSDGLMSGSSTSTENKYALFGYVLRWAMVRMGFVCEDVKKEGL